VLLRTVDDGISWVRKPQTTVTDRLTDIRFSGSSAGWISGGSGVILQTTNGGTIWVERPVRSNAVIRAVFFINDKTGWAVGDNGTILYSVDGGLFWVRQFKL